MAKTEMTTRIEQALKTYNPATLGGVPLNKMRPSYIEFEVPVECGTNTAGVIDAVGIDEYFSAVEEKHLCWWTLYAHAGIRKNFAAKDCARSIDKVKDLPLECAANCRYSQLGRSGKQDIMIECYEIKISKADFKSKNGHNFVGNVNYYVVPNSLYHEVKDLVPEGIGVIVFFQDSQYPTLRRKKDAEFRPMSDEDQKWKIS